MPAQGHWCWSTLAQTHHTDVCQVLGKRLALLWEDELANDFW